MRSCHEDHGGLSSSEVDAPSPACTLSVPEASISQTQVPQVPEAMLSPVACVESAAAPTVAATSASGPPDGLSGWTSGSPSVLAGTTTAGANPSSPSTSAGGVTSIPSSPSPLTVTETSACPVGVDEDGFSLTASPDVAGAATSLTPIASSAISTSAGTGTPPHTMRYVSANAMAARRVFRVACLADMAVTVPSDVYVHVSFSGLSIHTPYT